MRQLTDKQCAVILMRDWLTGRTDPLHLDADEMSNILELKREMSDDRRTRILAHVAKIREPLEVRIENLYSKIEGWS
ncbi:hypothetical protein MG295_00213 [Bacillus phage vB_BcgM]|nr:hypothetical protein MG295_00213 [Bacillus phage vB_BcgM]